jgi:hypothetical protein
VASKTVVEWVDDIDGGPAAETVSFALDGVEYEIDLSTEHATQLRTALKEFIRKARPENSAPRTPAEDDDELGLLPAPVVSESSRHLPAPRSAIKSRIPANQLAMDGFDDEPPVKPARKAAAAKKEPAKPAKSAAVKTPAKTVTTTAAPTSAAVTPAAVTSTPAATTAAPTTAVASTAPAKPADTKPAAQSMPTAAQPKAEPKPAAAPAKPAAAQAKPEPKPVPAQTPATKPEPAPAAPQRPTVASPFSQPAPGSAAPATKKDTPPRPPMITFSSAKQ